MAPNTASEQPFYPSGHHPSVLRSHQSRSAAECAAHLLPHLRSTDSLLDIGCGPATITCDFAKIVHSVVGLEHPSGAAVLDTAKQTAAERGVEDKVSFQLGDAAHLPFPDDSFDVVYCHQVLQHVSDPVRVLGEMRRVSKRIVCAREADFETMTPHPADERDLLKRWKEMWYQVAKAGGGQPDAGRRLKAWALEAGFAVDQVEVKAGSTTPEVKWWSEMWADRIVSSDWAAKAKAICGVDETELQEIAMAWREWGKKDEAWFGYLQGDLLAWKCQE
ncbi:SPOSA6832_01534, partial [Sporobolomyces salmonicolor]